MSLSLMQQKQLQKKELQHHCRKIEEVLNEVSPHHHFNNLSMNDDVELQVRCDQVYVIALGFMKEMEPYGISQVKLIHFHMLKTGFSVLVEDIANKINELYGKSTM